MANKGKKLGHLVKVKSTKRGATAVDREIATRIRARRLEIGLSQDSLGKELGLTLQQVQKYEKGTNRIAAARLVEIAGILNVDVMYFLTGLKSANVTDKALAAKSRFADFMATPDGVEINDAMLKLGAGHRRNVIDLARTLVRAYGD